MSAAEFAALLESVLNAEPSMGDECDIAKIANNSRGRWHTSRGYGGLTVQLESGERFVIEVRPSILSASERAAERA